MASIFEGNNNDTCFLQRYVTANDLSKKASTNKGFVQVQLRDSLSPIRLSISNGNLF